VSGFFIGSGGIIAGRLRNAENCRISHRPGVCSDGGERDDFPITGSGERQ